MSDFGRKDLSSQVSDKITPDSQKSTTQRASEFASGTYDQAAAVLQPSSEKSTTQKLGDSTRGSANNTENQGKGILTSAKEGAANVAQSASDNIKGAANYVSGESKST